MAWGELGYYGLVTQVRVEPAEDVDGDANITQVRVEAVVPSSLYNTPADPHGRVTQVRVEFARGRTSDPIESRTFPTILLGRSNLSTVDTIGRSYAVPYDNLYASTSGPVGHYARWLKWFVLAQEPKEMHWIKQTGDISLCCRTPAVSQSLTLKIYTNGDTGTARFTDTKTVSTGTFDKPQILYWPATSIQGQMIGVEISGTWTCPMSFEWISIDYNMKDPAKGNLRT